MKEHPHLRPDPLLPEHQLIRDAAVLPVLSSSFKARVMTGCETQIGLARWRFRLKVGLSLTAVCCLVFCLKGQFRAPSPGAEQSETPAYSRSQTAPAGTRRTYVPGTGSEFAQDHLAAPSLGSPLPNTLPSERRKDAEQIHQMIEQLQQRERKLCGLLPWL